MLFEQDDRPKVQATHSDKIGRVLTALDAATGPDGMTLPSFRLHPLKDELTGCWAVSMSGNWRIVWRFEGPDAVDVDLIDYH